MPYKEATIDKINQLVKDSSFYLEVELVEGLDGNETYFCIKDRETEVMIHSAGTNITSALSWVNGYFYEQTRVVFKADDVVRINYGRLESISNISDCGEFLLFDRDNYIDEIPVTNVTHHYVGGWIG